MNLRDETFDFSFRVVVYRDGDMWDAHALELDIVGCGDTPEEAIKELIELIDCQVSFALQQEDPSLIFRDAPEEIIQMWKDAEEKKMESIFTVEDQPRRVSGNTLERDSVGPHTKYLGISGEKISNLRRSHLTPVVCR